MVRSRDLGTIRRGWEPICIAHRRSYLKCAQTWITQFYLQITPCLPLLPSRRASAPFGWYSFCRPTEGRRLSRPGWLVTYRNKVPPPGVEPGHGHPSSTNRAQRTLTSLIETNDVTTTPCCPSVFPGVGILTVTHQGAACDTASVHFGPTISRTDILAY